MLGLIGFIILVVVAGLSFAVSGAVVNVLQTTQLTIGAGIHVLPIQFPPDWPVLVDQLAVAFGLFIVLFALIMIVMISLMRPPNTSEADVSMEVLRREAKAKKKRR
jgi:hypothetical protein